MSDPSPYAPPQSDLKVASQDVIEDPSPSIHQGRTAWVWWISALLLLATMLNYMDRQTLANLAVRIKRKYWSDARTNSMEILNGDSAGRSLPGRCSLDIFPIGSQSAFCIPAFCWHGRSSAR